MKYLIIAVLSALVSSLASADPVYIRMDSQAVLKVQAIPDDADWDVKPKSILLEVQMDPRQENKPSVLYLHNTHEFTGPDYEGAQVGIFTGFCTYRRGGGTFSCHFGKTDENARHEWALNFGGGFFADYQDQEARVRRIEIRHTTRSGGYSDPFTFTNTEYRKDGTWHETIRSTFSTHVEVDIGELYDLIIQEHVRRNP